MSGEIETEAARPRPLSGGLWNIFSWLRREDSSSNDSLSSIGSTHTAASFAFLGPTHYSSTSPIKLLPPGPPTDTYKKRLLDRNLRREQDRDLTLHRKYGLYGVYDAFSLPSARRIAVASSTGQDRERRATSECLQRRPAHVPGKRRAPQPPLRVNSIGTASLTRCKRKRRAPPPPTKISIRTKENIENQERVPVNNSRNIIEQMDSKPVLASSFDGSVGSKSEKHSKMEAKCNNKKLRPEKNFIKQIFDNKKRHSSYEVSPSNKILPSISELDKEATEIIKASRQIGSNPSSKNCHVTISFTGSVTSAHNTTKVCNKCIKKYDFSLAACPYCASEKNLSSNHNLVNRKTTNFTNGPQNIYTQTEDGLTANKENKIAEREKLKGMLKEMKYSLPKRPKNNTNTQEIRKSFLFNSNDNPNSSLETPTLKVGSSLSQKTFNITSPSSTTFDLDASSGHKNNEITKTVTIVNNIPAEKIPTQKQTNVINTPDNIKKLNENNANGKEKVTLTSVTTVKDEVKTNKTSIELEKDKLFIENNFSSNEKRNIHTPLRISSLLNPVYIPKADVNIQPSNVADAQISKTTGQNVINKNLNQENKNLTQTESIKALNSLKTNSNEFDVGTKAPPQEKRIELIKSSTVKPIQISLNTPGPSSQNKSVSQGTSVATPLKSAPILNKRKINDNSENQYSRRRDLIIQLEQSILKGDEQSAADAAVKLAQLRLSCSVLSFSSQIIKDSTSKCNTAGETSALAKDNIIINPDEPSCSKTNYSTHSVVGATHNDTRNSLSVKSKTVREVDGDLETQKNEVVPQKATNDIDMAEIEVWVEDREAAQGPITLRIPRHAVLRELRREVETSLGLATRLQRWIIGRVLCTNDDTPLVTVAGPNFDVPFYLCLVEAGTNDDVGKALSPNNGVYSELMLLEQHALISNTETFECQVCMEECPVGEGVILRECVHAFCRHCLSDVIRYCEEPIVNCPALGCIGVMQEREIRALVSPQDYEHWLARGLAAAESGTRNAFHCRTTDCTGWAMCEPGVQKFPCPVCEHINCVLCQAIHEGETCEVYRKKIEDSVKKVDTKFTDEGTKTLLESLISKGEALECPECSAIITKKWGCDWIKCSACKTEICWVTRGRRWGPGGRGDTSGGCRCGVDGKRCHPACGYCH